MLSILVLAHILFGKPVPTFPGYALAMSKTMAAPIRSEADCDAALAEIERHFDNEPKPGTAEAGRFDVLAQTIADYEKRRWRI